MIPAREIFTDMYKQYCEDVLKDRSYSHPDSVKEKAWEKAVYEIAGDSELTCDELVCQDDKLLADLGFLAAEGKFSKIGRIVGSILAKHIYDTAKEKVCFNPETGELIEWDETCKVPLTKK